MRRGLASLIMGLSLLVATASWAGFIMSRTVLDPGRSERLADTLLDNTDVRAAIVDRLADSVESQIPAEIPVTRDLIEQGAESALDDPRVEELFRDGLVRAHQNALNGVDEPIMIDATALGAAGRDAVVALQPELDAVLPQSPAVEVELPSTGLSWLGTVKTWVDRVTIIGGAIAIIGVATAFVLARNRAAALRRVAFWAFGASAFWLAVAYGLPWVLGRVAPSSVSIASAAIDVFFGAMVRPALAMGGFGVVLLLLSLAWPSLTARRPAAVVDQPLRAAPDNRRVRPVVAAPSSIANQPPLRPLANAEVPAARPATQQPPIIETPLAPPVAARQAPGQPLDYRDAGTRRSDQQQEHNRDPTIQFPQIHSNVGAPQAQPSAPPTASPQTASPQTASQHGAPAAQRPQPDIDIDADAAADGDDFGAEWVEGVGYVEER